MAAIHSTAPAAWAVHEIKRLRPGLEKHVVISQSGKLSDDGVSLSKVFELVAREAPGDDGRSRVTAAEAVARDRGDGGEAYGKLCHQLRAPANAMRMP